MNTSRLQVFGIGAIFLTIIIVFLLSFLFQSSTPATQSTFVLSPTQIPSATPYVEPVVLNWETYTNDTYQFGIDYPSDWKQQEYKPSGDQGGITVAFSPDSLPCGNCSYNQEGFYSVHVYNHVSDPLLYDEYQKILQNAKTSKTDRQVVIDGAAALLHEKSIFVEHNGWTYEISLDQTGAPSSVDSSKLFVRAATSFKFTTLKFLK